MMRLDSDNILSLLLILICIGSFFAVLAVLVYDYATSP